MAKKVSKKAQVEVVAQAPVEVAPVPVEVKKAKEPESAETKWKRRLARWQAKAQAQGVDTKKLYEEALSA